jgi:hypothetical protein
MNQYSQEIQHIQKKYSILKNIFHRYVYFNEGFQNAQEQEINRVVRKLVSNKNNRDKNRMTAMEIYL